MLIKVKANAKINLMLDILSKMDNGYHNLFMVMQSVDLHDIITVSQTKTKKIEITCKTKGIPTDKTNIAYKAAQNFFESTGIKNDGIIIDIEKHIPHAAGLAGGSADGAAVVKALDEMHGTKLCESEMIAICKKFGSDIPFCAIGGTMLAQYDGTVISHLPSLDMKHIIIVKPNQAVSTGTAYSEFDNARIVRHLHTQGMLKAVIENDMQEIYTLCGNVFEQFIEVADRVPIKATMKDFGAKCTCMSGSGPSVFGVFEDEKQAKLCYEKLKTAFPETFLCSSVKHGCEIV
ncbi:MAG: 4-(cytidine 5'-diphospho)-2-C-methyl-D-erythritol kinase [Clostridia bacterium]